MQRLILNDPSFGLFGLLIMLFVGFALGIPISIVVSLIVHLIAVYRIRCPRCGRRWMQVFFDAPQCRVCGLEKPMETGQGRR